MKNSFLKQLLTLIVGICAATSALAGVFDTPQFVAPGKVGLGVEPVLTTSDGAGIGINARYKQGVTDFMDVNAILGTGSGPQRFRVGGNLTFDFIPDLENQPGIGIAPQVVYYRLPNSGMLEVTAIPYLHKSFMLTTAGESIDPFLSFPIGFDFSNGNYNVTSTLALGAMFHQDEHITYVGEVGIGMNRAETYLSGGLSYYP